MPRRPSASAAPGRPPAARAPVPTPPAAAGQRLEVRSTLGLGPGANPRWLALLAALETEGSITAAARRAGLSYKAAWDAIEAINNLSDEPVVASSVGGKGGGGARLTARGLQLVATAREIRARQARAMALPALDSDPDPDMTDASAPDAQRLLDRLTLRTSARNHLAGVVAKIQPGAVNDTVELRLPGGETVHAVITRESTEDLGLVEGAEAVALVKSSWVMVLAGDLGAAKLSARNRLTGTVTRLTPGAVNTEVVIGLTEGRSVVAVITRESAEDLGLREGAPATAVFKASSVILAVPPGAGARG